MVSLTHSFIECFYIVSENFFFPELSIVIWIIVFKKQKRNLKTGCVQFTSITNTFTRNLTCSISKNGKLHDGSTNFIKAYSLCGSRSRNTLSCFFDILCILQSCQVTFPILHRRSDETVLTCDWLVTEIFEAICSIFIFESSRFDSTL